MSLPCWNPSNSSPLLPRGRPDTWEERLQNSGPHLGFLTWFFTHFYIHHAQLHPYPTMLSCWNLLFLLVYLTKQRRAFNILVKTPHFLLSQEMWLDPLYIPYLLVHLTKTLCSWYFNATFLIINACRYFYMPVRFELFQDKDCIWLIVDCPSPILDISLPVQ